jgi:hypothetical protein
VITPVDMVVHIPSSPLSAIRNVMWIGAAGMM